VRQVPGQDEQPALTISRRTLHRFVIVAIAVIVLAAFGIGGFVLGRDTAPGRSLRIALSRATTTTAQASPNRKTGSGTTTSLPLGTSTTGRTPAATTSSSATVVALPEIAPCTDGETSDAIRPSTVFLGVCNSRYHGVVHHMGFVGKCFRLREGNTRREHMPAVLRGRAH
jgi:hypothetical protein